MKGEGSNTHSKDRRRKRPQIYFQSYFYLHYFEVNWSTLVSNEKQGEQQHGSQEAQDDRQAIPGEGNSNIPKKGGENATPPTLGKERAQPPKGGRGRQHHQKRGGENSTTTLERQVTTPPKRRRRRDAIPTPNKEGNGNHHFTLTHRTLLSLWFNMNYPNIVPQFTVHHKKNIET